jgi:diaminopimelate decarboxylase
MDKINFLDEMIEKYKTPLQLYDEDKIVEQINKLKDAFSNDFNFKNFFAESYT